MADNLTDYVLETRRLLHDALANYWSDDDLIDYVNRARNHVVTDTGCLRVLQTPVFQGNTENFAFGGVTAITVTAGGSGYTSAPSVTLTTGSGATGTASLSGSSVSSISVGSGGSGYVTPPSITFSGGGFTGNLSQQAQAHAVILAGVVTSIVVDYGGENYASAPTVTLTAVGSGAAATATVAGGAVTGVTVTAQGTGYLVAPTISFTGGGGSNAAATASILQSNTYDIINLTVIWGSMRIPMVNTAFTELSAIGRLWTQFQYRPGAYALYAKSVYVAPKTDQAYSMEADSVILPAPLTTSVQNGVLVDPEDEAVPYWAAYLAKMNEGQIDQASEFLTLYRNQINWANTAYTYRNQAVYQYNANIADD